jgi:hypothetical protein
VADELALIALRLRSGRARKAESGFAYRASGYGYRTEGKGTPQA